MLRTRATATLLLGVGLPGAVLAALALRSIQAEKVEAQRTAEERADRAADALASRIDEALGRIEAALVRRLSDGARAQLDPEDPPELKLGGVDPAELTPRGRSIARELEHLVDDEQLTLREAFLVSRDGHVLLPHMGHKPTPPRPHDPQDVQLYQFAKRESASTDLAWADSTLHNAIDLIKERDDDLASALRLKQAEIALKQNDLERALALAGDVRKNKDARDLDGAPLAPEAALFEVDLLARAGKNMAGIDELVELAFALAEDRWVQDAPSRRLQLDLTLAFAKALVASPSVPPGIAKFTTDKLDRVAGRVALHEALAEGRLLPELAARANPPAPGALVGTPARIGIEVMNDTRVFIAVAVEGPVAPSDAQPARPAVPRDPKVAEIAAKRPAKVAEPPRAPLAGVEIELPRLRELVAREIETAAPQGDARLAVIDGHGKLFAGDAELAKSASPNGGRPLAGEVFPGWRIVATPLDPDAPNRATRTKLLLIGALVAACAIAAIVAIVTSSRAVGREVEIARLRADLVRNVSHELRTPVASILMLAEVMEDGGLAREKETEYVGRIAGETRRLAKLIESVLDLAKIERGALQVELGPAPIGEAVAAIVENFRESEEGRKAGEITHEDRSDGALAAIDGDALSRIVVNFLTNAVKYSPEKSPIAVRTSAKEGELRVEVVDRGRGISREESARLFVPFYRARPEDGHASGVGLGLVIAHELARLMGGKIDIQSEPGKGSTFALVLPRAKSIEPARA